MTTAATHTEHHNTKEGVLFMAFELSEKTWKLGFTMGYGQKPRERTMTRRVKKLMRPRARSMWRASKS